MKQHEILNLGPVYLASRTYQYYKCILVILDLSPFFHYRPTAAASTTPPTPAKLHVHALSIPLAAVLDGVLLAAALLVEEAALEVAASELLDAEPEAADPVTDPEEEDLEEPEEEGAPEVDEDRPTVALDRVTEAYAHCSM
jgi:hypothetical protein